MSGSRTRGRPRRPGTDEAIVAATLELLRETGYAGLTIEAVAARAGVSRPTVYRRAASKEDLVTHVLDCAVAMPSPATDDAVPALAQTVRAAVDALGASALGPAVVGVLAAAAGDPRLAAVLHERYLDRRLTVVDEMIRRAIAAGAIRDDLGPAVVRDLLVGPFAYHWLTHAAPLRAAELGALVVALTDALGPDAPSRYPEPDPPPDLSRRTPEPLRFRPAADEDLEIVSSFPKDADELFFSFPQVRFPLTARQLRDAVAQRSDSTVALLDGSVVAFASLTPSQRGGSCAIGNLMVSRAVRRRGIGSATVARMAEIAFARHEAAEVTIACFSQNTAGMLLSSRLGFRPYAVEERAGEDGAPVALVRMRLPRPNVPRLDAGAARDRAHRVSPDSPRVRRGGPLDIEVDGEHEDPAQVGTDRHPLHEPKVLGHQRERGRGQQTAGEHDGTEDQGPARASGTMPGPAESRHRHGDGHQRGERGEPGGGEVDLASGGRRGADLILGEDEHHEPEDRADEQHGGRHPQQPVLRAGEAGDAEDDQQDVVQAEQHGHEHPVWRENPAVSSLLACATWS